jgi:hypothetical protein
MTDKILVKLVQFYVTHTCNISCPNCLSLNNFSISGHDTYNQSLVKRWRELIDIEDLTIIGGEPLTNPNLNEWVRGLRSTFYDVVDFKICTNGILLDKWVNHAKKWIDDKIVIEISIHSSKYIDRINSAIDRVIGDLEVEVFEKEYPGYDFPEYYRTYDKIFFYKKFPAFLIKYSYNFTQWGVKKIEPTVLKFYKTDPVRAHARCPYNDCHYIYKGEMYKCGTLVGAKELNKNYNVDPLSNFLISDYKPISLNDEDIKEKLSNITKTELPQCAMCPVGEQGNISLEDVSIKKLPPHKK